MLDLTKQGYRFHEQLKTVLKHSFFKYPLGEETKTVKGP
jgi:hypothetical protein